VNLISVFSLALFLAVGVLWLWSTQTFAQREWGGGGKSTVLLSVNGEIELTWGGAGALDPADDPPDAGWSFRPAIPSESLETNHDRSIIGFAFDRRQTPAGTKHSVLFAEWILLIPLAIMPIYWLLRAAGILKQKGYCFNCKTSFTDKHNRCPHCGTVWV